MADPAHKWTDEQLDALEKRIAKEYKRAAKEAEEKLNAYLQKFAEDAEKQKALLDAGKITQQEYNDFIVRKTMMGRRWEAIRDTLAQDFHNANRIAMSVARGHLPEVYCVNHDFAVYQIEHDAAININYTLYDRDTAERLLREELKLLPDPKPGSEAYRRMMNKDLRWNRSHIQSEVLQGILQGEHMKQIADRMQRVSDMNESAAIRNARTMYTGAQNAGRNAGYRRLVDEGLDLEKEWIATLDGHTRRSHRFLHGERIPVDDIFSNGCEYPGDPYGAPAEVYNCFVGESYVATDSDVIRGYKHLYKGEFISVKTSGGIGFTCTPNHPILTPRGWVAAKLLNKGDNICVAFVCDSVGSRRNPDVYHGFARFDALLELLGELGCKRTRRGFVNFHGDVPTSDVEIVTQEGFLRNNGDVSEFEKEDELRFKFSDISAFGESAFSKHLRGIWFSALSFIRGKCNALSLLWRRLSHADIHGFRSSTNRNSGIIEYAINDLPAETEIRSELVNGLSGKVGVDDVVSVNVFVDERHVYNLQTDSGYYFVNSIIPDADVRYNGIVAKNCRCSMIGQIKGFQIARVERSPKMGDMSFEEWRESRPVRR